VAIKDLFDSKLFVGGFSRNKLDLEEKTHNDNFHNCILTTTM